MKRFLITVLGGLLGGVLGAAGFDAAEYIARHPEVQVEPAVKVEPAAPVAPVVAPPGEVKATAFVLVDSAGNVRAHLGSVAGETIMDIRDVAGKPRIIMGVDDDKARVIVNGNDSRANVGIAVFQRAPVVVLSDENGAMRANMGVLPGSGPWVSLSDANGNVTWSTDRPR